jgi:CheY-like chemotaxis protein
MLQRGATVRQPAGSAELRRTARRAGRKIGRAALALGRCRSAMQRIYQFPVGRAAAEGRPQSLGSPGQAGEAPRPSPAEPPGSAPGRDTEEPAPLAPRILVVEDDDPVRDHAVRVVRSLGYEVRAARDAQDALRLLAEDLRCDPLFTDVVMPGMSGGQLAQAVRMLIPGLPVVFVTGHNSDAAVEQLRRDGGAILLPKPYRRQALAAALRSALGEP